LERGRTYTKAMQTKQNDPQTKNTLLCRLAPLVSTMYGVTYAITKLSSQLLAVLERELAVFDAVE
jgi:hypothetical protein